MDAFYFLEIHAYLYIHSKTLFSPKQMHITSFHSHNIKMTHPDHCGVLLLTVLTSLASVNTPTPIVSSVQAQPASLTARYQSPWLLIGYSRFDNEWQVRLCIQTTPYYDMSYQTPTTLAAVRDATLGNVGYSISDGRYTRGDNNASPVPSTLSQQTSTLTQGHQAQPILAGTAPPYFFATAFNTIAPNYQFGTMYTVSHKIFMVRPKWHNCV